MTPPPPRTALAVWAVGMAAYIVAVLHRTSLGVAGLDLADRFGVSASILASFAVVQLVVYAGLQIPVGVMVDRFGPRRLLLTGALVMAGGQLILALAAGLGAVTLGRVLVGAGDAMTFISVLRLVAAWFAPRRAPVMSQLTGLIGQTGQVLSVFPFLALLHGPGWTAAFGAAGALGVLVAVAVAAVVRDSPGAPGGGTHPGPAQVWSDLVQAWRHPGTRLGLWSHFTTQFSGSTFALLWGFPFLISGQGLQPAVASSLFTLQVVAGVAVAVPLGRLVSNHPLRRSWLVLGIVAVTAGTWTVVLAWPGRAPLWLLVVLALALALGGPGSMIGFDFARTFNPPMRLGSASGIVNVGGFVATLITILAMGLVLDVLSPGTSGSTYRLADFRWAFAVQYLVWTAGVVGIVSSRRRVRRRMADAGQRVPPLREALARERHRRRSR